MDYWQECAMYRQHAVDCGIDLTCAAVVPCDARAAGYIIKVSPLHPETLEELVPEGFSLTAEQCETLHNECGIDYLIVQGV